MSNKGIRNWNQKNKKINKINKREREEKGIDGEWDGILT